MDKKEGFYFRDWLAFYGRARLADKLGVTKACVDKWAVGGLPQGNHLRALKKISGGHVDYIHILDGAEIKTALPKNQRGA